MTSGVLPSIPRSKIKDEPELKRYKILAMLEDNPNEPFTAYEIAKYCNYPLKGSQPEVRKAIAELIIIDNEPIISMNNGFMYTSEYDLLEGYCQNLESRASGIFKRVRALRHIQKRLLKEQCNFPGNDD